MHRLQSVQSLQTVLEVIIGVRSRLLRGLVKRLEESFLKVIGFERLQERTSVNRASHLSRHAVACRLH